MVALAEEWVVRVGEEVSAVDLIHQRKEVDGHSDGVHLGNMETCTMAV